MQWKSPAGRLERKARSRSDAPQSIADSAPPEFIADSIDALDIFSIVMVVTVVIVVAVTFIIARTMELIVIAAVTVLGRASSPIVSTARRGTPGLTTA